MQIVLWGAGYNLEYVANQILKDNRIVAVVDSNPDKIGCVSSIGEKIDSPDIIKAIKFDSVVITAEKSHEIRLMCEELGVEKNKIVSYWEDVTSEGLFENRALLSKSLFLEKKILQCRLENALYEWGVMGKSIVVKSSEELLARIIATRKSLVRFGDGEFECIMKRHRPWFQEPNENLSKRLEEVLHSSDNRILYAIADNYGSLEKYTEDCADAIRKYNVNSGIRSYVEDLSKEFYDAYVSRPYLMYKDKSHAKRVFDLFDELFSNRNILVVEGSDGRTGINNGLFSGAKSVRRIVCPAKNAFDKYDKILDSVKRNAEKGDLIYISLGPTATVLAYDLTQNDFQALDLGQLDNEIDWWKMGAQKRELIPGKMVAELSPSIDCQGLVIKGYLEQIVDTVS